MVFDLQMQNYIIVSIPDCATTHHCKRKIWELQTYKGIVKQSEFHAVWFLTSLPLGTVDWNESSWIIVFKVTKRRELLDIIVLPQKLQPIARHLGTTWHASENKSFLPMHSKHPACYVRRHASCLAGIASSVILSPSCCCCCFCCIFAPIVLVLAVTTASTTSTASTASTATTTTTTAVSPTDYSLVSAIYCLLPTLTNNMI